MEPKNDEALLGSAAPGESDNKSTAVTCVTDSIGSTYVRTGPNEFTATNPDGSEFLVNIDYASGQDYPAMSAFVGGLRTVASVTINGHWEPSDALSNLALSVALGGIRAPRKTKKAFRKLWTGEPLNLRERDRIRRMKPYENA
jgi:hypothetical protein